MTLKSPGKLRIPQWSIVNRLITAEDVTFDQYGKEVSRARTDLTGGVVYLTVRDDSGMVVIQKSSTVISEIEHKDQTVPATRGQAVLKFVYADTAPLSSATSMKYWFDIWVVTADGREEPIVDRGRFHVDRSATHIALGPSPSLPTYPAPQTPQERSFLWTWSATGVSDTVIIPGGAAMRAANYVVVAMVEDGPAVALSAASASRTTTGFVLSASGVLPIGNTVGIVLRDIS